MSNKHVPVTPKSFCKFFLRDWSERMTGPFSLMFSLAGIFSLAFGATQLPLHLDAILAGFLISIAALFSAYKAVKVERLKVIELERIDRKDIQNIIDGWFNHNGFTYNGVRLCKQFKGKLEIDSLHNKFIAIKIAAPRNSWAQIEFQFTNGHQSSDGRILFSVLDKEKKEIALSNIHDRQNVYVDENFSVHLKYGCNELYNIHDQAELWIMVHSWRFDI